MSRVKLLDWFRSGGTFLAQASGALAAGLAKGFAPRVKSAGERVFSGMLGYSGFGSSLGAWGDSKVEQVLHYRHWVYKAIDTISTLATKEPPSVVRVSTAREAAEHRQKLKAWTLKQAEHPGDRPFLTAAEHRKALTAVKPHEALEHVDANHPLLSLLRNPNPPDTGASLWEEAIMFGELTGEVYLWPVPYRGAPGYAELWVMPSHWVWPQKTGKTDRMVDYYEVRPWGPGATASPVIFDADEFIPILNKSPLSKIKGQSRLQAAAEMVDSYENVALARYFQILNGSNIGTSLEITDGSQDINLEKMKRLKAQFLAAYQGPANFNAPAITPPGTKLNRPPADLELAYGQSSDQLRKYVAAMWGIPESVFGFMEDANRAAFEAALLQTYALVVNPRLARFGHVLTEKLAVKYGKDLRVFWPDMSPADRAGQLAEWNSLTKAAPYKGNEFRTWMGLEPLDEGDEVIMPMGVGPAGGDPFAGMSDDDLMGRMRSMADGSEGEGGKRLDFSLNGRH